MIMITHFSPLFIALIIVLFIIIYERIMPNGCFNKRYEMTPNTVALDNNDSIMSEKKTKLLSAEEATSLSKDNKIKSEDIKEAYDKRVDEIVNDIINDIIIITKDGQFELRFFILTYIKGVELKLKKLGYKTIRYSNSSNGIRVKVKWGIKNKKNKSINNIKKYPDSYRQGFVKMYR